MEPIQEPTSTIIPNKLFLSGSDIQTPIADGGGHTPSHTRPILLTNGTNSSVGTFAVKAGLAQMLKI